MIIINSSDLNYWQKIVLFVLLFIIESPFFISAQPTKIWDITLGSFDRDENPSIIETVDGGFLVAGTSYGSIGGDRTDPSRGESDFWVVKIDNEGVKQWDRTYGGDARDLLTTILPVNDGGYLLVGSSDSGISGEQTQPPRGELDYWIVKIRADGRKVWDKRYGGPGNDWTMAAANESTNFIISGGAELAGGDITVGPVGQTWSIKIDESGNILWESSTLPGALYKIGAVSPSIIDSGIFLGVAGYSVFPNYDPAIFKLDVDGNELWYKFNYIRSVSLRPPGPIGRYGLINAVQELSTGDIAVAGTAHFWETGDNFWYYNLRPTGGDRVGINIREKVYFSKGNDVLSTAFGTPRALFLLSGTTNNDIGSPWVTEPSRGTNDYWLMQIDYEGNRIWDKRFGGSNVDVCTDVKLLEDGSFILAGKSFSGISGDKTESNKGGSDYWVIKTTPDQFARIIITDGIGVVAIPPIACQTFGPIDEIIPCEWPIPFVGLPQGDIKLRFNFKHESMIKSAVFHFNGQVYTDNNTPFILFPNPPSAESSQNILKSSDLPVGEYSLQVDGFEGPNGKGKVIEAYDGRIVIK